VRIGLENLPSWEAMPSEQEMELLGRRFGTAEIGYWHDTGHGQVRENLGLITHAHWLGKLAPLLVGLHVHDVMPPARDHVMPPVGMIDFASLLTLVPDDALLVVEPDRIATEAEVREGLRVLREAWEETRNERVNPPGLPRGSPG
jgi:sugar phosphate isomerase/epimerase